MSQGHIERQLADGGLRVLGAVTAIVVCCLLLANSACQRCLGLSLVLGKVADERDVVFAGEGCWFLDMLVLTHHFKSNSEC